MGNDPVIRLGILTSSRADFGIYLPLLRRLFARQTEFLFELIVFGTHMSRYHGHTEDDIVHSGFEVRYRVPTLLLTDDPGSISTSYGLTAVRFADFWERNVERFDIVLCLGDRYEMAAAVAAGIPLGVKFAHIHGGETTLGAIDNVYRHSITLASKLHFVATDPYAERVRQLVGPDAVCYVTGSLSLDSINDLELQNYEEFNAQWGVDLSIPTVLVTVHPETVSPEANNRHIVELDAALYELCSELQVVVTMPNADTLGSLYREMFNRLAQRAPSKFRLFENLGTRSYFSCMRLCRFLLGNTSSGIIEAASFSKFVINVGDRQKGRLSADNVMHVPFQRDALTSAARRVMGLGLYQGTNPYYRGGAAEMILSALKAQCR